MPACRLLYPGGLAGSDRSWAGVFQPVPWSPATTAFPRTQMGRRPRHNLSGPHRKFTCVTACLLAGPPSGPLRRRLRRLRYLHRRSDCYRLERTSCRAGVAPTEDLYLFTAHYVPVLPCPRDPAMAVSPSHCTMGNLPSAKRGEMVWVFPTRSNASATSSASPR